ncbi:MAG: ABC transporter substrate-binding protein [Chloroflexi bacterium]|nr:ABC transporter substrate-binding protein [Chloroflexota bacterium]
MRIVLRFQLSVLLSALMAQLLGCGQQAQEPLGRIRFGVETSILSAPVWIAESRGMFREQGLDVEIREFDSGRTAFRTMLTEGGLDMVTVAQIPVMLSSFTRSDYAIIAAMTFTDNDIKVVCRQDRGIRNPSDHLATNWENSPDTLTL